MYSVITSIPCKPKFARVVIRDAISNRFRTTNLGLRKSILSSAPVTCFTGISLKSIANLRNFLACMVEECMLWTECFESCMSRANKHWGRIFYTGIKRSRTRESGVKILTFFTTYINSRAYYKNCWQNFHFQPESIRNLKRLKRVITGHSNCEPGFLYKVPSFLKRGLGCPNGGSCFLNGVPGFPTRGPQFIF